MFSKGNECVKTSGIVLSEAAAEVVWHVIVYILYEQSPGRENIIIYAAQLALKE